MSTNFRRAAQRTFTETGLSKHVYGDGGIMAATANFLLRKVFEVRTKPPKMLEIVPSLNSDYNF